MEQPLGSVVQDKSGRLSHRCKSVYGLKQSPCAWFGKFNQTVEKFGMRRSKFDHPVFYKNFKVGIILLVVYVKD